MRRHALRALSDDEKIARYAHVLGEVPSSIADRAYAEAFERLPSSVVHGLIAEVCAQLPGAGTDGAPDDAVGFALLMRDLHARVAVVTCTAAAELAVAFVTSRPVAAHYRSGTGSLSIDHQPPWVHALADHETAPVDSGTAHHGRGAISGEQYG